MDRSKEHLQNALQQWKWGAYEECVGTCRKVKEALFREDGGYKVQERLQERGVKLGTEIDNILKAVQDILNTAEHDQGSDSQTDENERQCPWQ